MDGEVVGAIERGFLVLVAAVAGDTGEDAAWLERKLLTLRVFSDDAGKMNRSVIDIKGALLLVSQFTLAAETSKGARPSFLRAMDPELARPFLERLVAKLRMSIEVQTGRFGSDMQIELVNDGPVTLWLDSKEPR